MRTEPAVKAHQLPRKELEPLSGRANRVRYDEKPCGPNASQAPGRHAAMRVIFALAEAP